MLDKDHVWTSEALYLIFLDALKFQAISINIQFSLLTCCATATGIWLGSQLPDIDSKTSKISKYTKPISNIFSKLGHHGITHSLFGLGFIAILCLVLLPKWLDISNIYIINICWGITIGYALHIIEDAFSKAGVIWLFPFYPAYHKWRYNIFVRNNINTKIRYKTGGKFERMIRYTDIIIIMLSILYYLQ